MNQSGLWISDLFPGVAQHADDLCLILGMHSRWGVLTAGEDVGEIVRTGVAYAPRQGKGDTGKRQRIDDLFRMR
jgi:hypothetical protein